VGCGFSPQYCSRGFSIYDEAVMESDNSVNLMTHRSDVNVWERSRRPSWTIEDRFGSWVVPMAGAGLLAYGTYCATRRPGRGLWWVATGASLLVCAAAGLGSPQALRARWAGAFEQAPDAVTQESLDSFPASDAPSSNATTTTPQPLDGGRI
jgi:hypothetical protein